MMWRSRTVAAVALSGALLLTSCTRVIDDARGVAAEPGQLFGSSASAVDCTPVDTELVDVPAPDNRSAYLDPVLRIPQPDGWKRITALDSQMIRFVMRNDDLARDGVAPTAVVTLESHRGELSPRAFFDEQRDQVSQLGVTELELTDSTLCGLPAVRGSYMSPLLGTAGPRRAELLSAVMFTEGTTYGVALTLQSADEDDPAYQRDSSEILDGFQMLSPGTR
ncbi:LpqN/LpqT family lipoprotein [Mycobacterium sp. 236(2023)]|uniref:LpqN/LpqT family lipoprotein n=1 Tax=Mycobacterium sp. 236(2023) TaxID=3038163 RepID=UPI00241590FB|nr:LpqN/LpqT family lipoprotein [Mycobacterium sp. 236(2023)]MDG4665839.1 LpqN/LpqT family lipoprotein [Mycobacterium sp. 236(2023)]